MYERILAAIDATPNENAVLNHTQRLAQLTGATVHLLHVAALHVTPGDIMEGAALGHVPSDDDFDTKERVLLQAAVDQLSAAGITAKGELARAEEHDIADVILERAKALDVQLIVLGETMHRRGFFHVSVADEVVHHHPRSPILLVP
jgi:nucleotide-binding universal stress UspA family protein